MISYYRRSDERLFYFLWVNYLATMKKYICSETLQRFVYTLSFSCLLFFSPERIHSQKAFDLLARKNSNIQAILFHITWKIILIFLFYFLMRIRRSLNRARIIWKKELCSW